MIFCRLFKPYTVAAKNFQCKKIKIFQISEKNKSGFFKEWVRVKGLKIWWNKF